MYQCRNPTFNVHYNHFINIVTPGSLIHFSKCLCFFLQAFGPVSQMTESAVTQIGCIAQGFSNSDLEKLPFSLDTLEEIAHCSWNESQVEYKKSSICR